MRTLENEFEDKKCLERHFFTARSEAFRQARKRELKDNKCFLFFSRVGIEFMELNQDGMYKKTSGTKPTFIYRENKSNK